MNVRKDGRVDGKKEDVRMEGKMCRIKEGCLDGRKKRGGEERKDV